MAIIGKEVGVDLGNEERISVWGSGQAWCTDVIWVVHPRYIINDKINDTRRFSATRYTDGGTNDDAHIEFITPRLSAAGVLKRTRLNNVPGGVYNYIRTPQIDACPSASLFAS